MTKWQLFSLLSTPNTAWFRHENKDYILLSIARESGDGRSFIISALNTQNQRCAIFIRTVD